MFLTRSRDMPQPQVPQRVDPSEARELYVLVTCKCGLSFLLSSKAVGNPSSDLIIVLSIRSSLETMSTFVTWPPVLQPDQLEHLTLLATTYALSHSLLYLPPHSPESPPPTTPTSAIHAPFSLFPTPIPRSQFDLAKRLQRAYNVLYARVAMDEEFLDEVMGEGSTLR